MLNFIYLVVLCLFISIMIMSSYKYLRRKKWIISSFSILYILLVMLFSYFIFFTRNALNETELERMFHLIKNGNIFAIITFLFQIGLIVFGVFNYIKVTQMEKENIRKKRIKKQK